MNKPGQGTMRVNASHHAACRTSSPWPRCGSFSTPAAISASPAPARKQIYGLLEGALRAQKYLELSKKDKGIVRRYLVKISGLRKAQNHPFDRPLARARRHRAASLAAPPLPTPLYARRYPAAGRDRCRSRRPLGSGRAPHPAARIQGPSPGRIRTTGLDLGLSYLQLAAHPGLSRTPCPSHQDARLGGEHRRAPQAPARAASPATCGSTRCTRATPAPARGSTTSTPSTRSRNGRWWAAAKPISEAHLLPVLRGDTASIPFRIRGFHSDNGSEFLNYKVQQLLNKLLVPGVHQVAGQSHHRQRFGGRQKTARWYASTSDTNRSLPRHTGQVQRFYTADFNPYLNYHRPCGFATIELSDNGKRRRRYRLNDYRTPYEKLLSLNDWGELPEGRRQRGQTRATGAADERHRVRATDAATQKKTAGRLPRAALELPALLATALPSAGPDGPGLDVEGRGKGKPPRNLRGRGKSVHSFPPPPCPPPLSKPLDPLRKGDPHPAACPFPPGPISGSSLDWKMLHRHARRPYDQGHKVGPTLQRGVRFGCDGNRLPAAGTGRRVMRDNSASGQDGVLPQPHVQVDIPRRRAG